MYTISAPLNTQANCNSQWAWLVLSPALRSFSRSLDPRRSFFRSAVSNACRQTALEPGEFRRTPAQRAAGSGTARGGAGVVGLRSTRKHQPSPARPLQLDGRSAAPARARVNKQHVPTDNR